MSKLASYQINEYTKDKKGYLKFEKCTILFPNPTSKEYEVKIACVEIFGRAIKVSISDSNGCPKYVFNHLANCQIESKVMKYIKDDCFWFQFNNVIMLANKELMSALNEYILSVENMYELYYLHEYEKEISQISSYTLINNNDLDLKNMTGQEFELHCKKLIDKMGFETELTKASGDGGIDIIAYNHQPLLSGKYIIQCKRYSGSVGEPIIRDLYGVVTSERANKGILITTGYFTKSAIGFAKDKQIELIDGDRLNELFINYDINVGDGLSRSSKRSISDILDDAYCDSNAYNNKLQILSNNPNDEITRVKLIEQLVGAVLGTVPYVDSNEEKLIIFSEIKKQIELYLKSVNRSNEKSKYLNTVLKIFYIQLSILEGNFTEAFKKYIELINQRDLHIYSKDGVGINPDLVDNSWLFQCLYSISYDMVQISLLADDTKFSDRIYQVGKNIFSTQQAHLSLSSINFDGELTEAQISFAKREYRKLERIKTFNSLYLLDEFVISNCLDYVYYNAPVFSCFIYSFPTVISNNNVIMQNSDSLASQEFDASKNVLNPDNEYFRIENWKDCISDAVNNL